MTHPVDRVDELIGGRDRVVLLWVGAFAAPLLIFPEGSAVGAWLALGTFVAGAIAFSHRSSEWSQTEDAVDDAQARYADGEIDLVSFEREVELALDDRAAEIRDRVEDVGGIGPATSANIALAFRSIDDVREADAEALAAVNGVGPQRAEAIVERLGEVDR